MITMKNELADLSADYAELGVDTLIANMKQYVPVLNDISEEIPIVKSLLVVAKLPRSVTDVYLSHKLAAFLFSSRLTQEKRQKLQKTLSKHQNERLWQRISLAINSHDDIEKTKIVGKLFAAHLEDAISYDDFLTLVYVTNTVNIIQLADLLEFYKLDPAVRGKTTRMFEMLGLLTEYHQPAGGGWGSSGSAVVHAPTALGWKYMGIVFDYPVSLKKGYRVGRGNLIKELTEGGIWTGHAYPIGVIMSENKRYTVIEVYAVDANGRVYCKDSIPVKIGDGVPTLNDADLSLFTLERIARPRGYTNLSSALSSDNSIREIRQTYAAITDIGPEGSIPIDVAEICRILEAKDPAEVSEYSHLKLIFERLRDLLSQQPDFFSKKK